MSKLKQKKNDVTQWKIQADNIKSNQRVKVNFYLPESSVTKVVTWEFHVDGYYKSSYDNASHY